MLAPAAFWRIILGINLLYELALVFLLFQDLDSARSMMKFLDPSLGRPLPEKSYAENCDLTVENVWVRSRVAVVSRGVLSVADARRRRTHSIYFVLHTRWVGLARL